MSCHWRRAVARHGRAGGLLWLLWLLAAPLALAEERQALVIGNGAYAEAPLKNAANDARDVAARLERLGFRVTRLLDADQRAMETAIKEFARALGGGGMGLFYYAGHGLGVDGENYLVPIGARIESESDVRYKAVAAGWVLDGMRRAGNNLNLVVLDACRNNPYSRGFRNVSRGLARMDPASGSLVFYATEPGKVAADGDGRNGVFTQHLLAALEVPGLSVLEVVQRTAIAVNQATGGRQTPWQEGMILGQFYFQPPRTAGAAPPAAAPAPAVTPPRPAVTPAPAAASTSAAARQSFEPELVRIRGGCFQMGSPESETGRDSDERQRRVCVKDFKLGKYEVTVGEFRRFVEASGYRTEAERNVGQSGCYAYDLDQENNGTWDWRAWASWRKPSQHQGNRDTHPVSCVSWNDAAAYLDWLNAQGGGRYRLPTEAEWEYAARAGTTTARFWGEGPDRACRYANVADRTKLPNGGNWSPLHDCDDGHAFAAAVGRFQPNPWGLHDMLGNVWEWTCSAWASSYDGSEGRCVSKDHAGPVALRGGSWNGVPAWVRSAYRSGYSPDNRNDNIGFRLVQD